MLNKFINFIIGLDFILPLLTVGMIQYLNLTAFIIILLGLVLIRLIDIFGIYQRKKHLSQYQNSMRSVIVFYHHNRLKSFLIYLLAIVMLGLIKMLLIN